MEPNTPNLLAENQGLRAALLAAQAEAERLQDIINQQAELIRKYEIDNRQLEHLLQHYKGMVDEA